MIEIFNLEKYNMSMKCKYLYNFYYSQNYSGKKEEKKKDNKGIRELYIKFREYDKKKNKMRLVIFGKILI